MSKTGIIKSAVEIVPLAQAGQRTPHRGVIYQDIKSITTNKSVSAPGAGNFTVVFGMPHGTGFQADAADNDLIKIYASRGGARHELPKDMIFTGQIDRITRTSKPDYVEWSLRGKCLTKQFLTNIMYVSMYDQYEDPETRETVVGVLPEVTTLQQIALNMMGCTKWVTITEKTTGNKLAGLSLQEFLEKFIGDSPWVDADLLTGMVIHAEHLLLRSQDSPAFQQVFQVIEGLADRPYVYWYVDELGVFHFKPWNWRNGKPNMIVSDEEYLNDNTSTADMKIIAGCAVMPEQGTGGAPFAGWAIYYDPMIGARYGTRFMRLSGTKYIYTYQMAQRRAKDHVQLQYLGRIESQVTVRGDPRWRIDRNVFVQRLGGYFYCDSVQHRIDYSEADANWTTTLGLTHGRADANSFATHENGDATIIADVVAAGIDLDRVSKVLQSVNRPPEVTRIGR